MSMDMLSMIERYGFDSDLRARLGQLLQPIEAQPPASVEQLNRWYMALVGLSEAAVELAGDIEIEIDARRANAAATLGAAP